MGGGGGPWRSAPFRWLLAGRTVDAVGNAVSPIALGFAMLDLFGSAAALGTVVGVRSLGNVLLVLVGGVVADRLPRAVVLVGSNVLAGLTQVAMALLVLAEVRSLPLLLLLAFTSGGAAAFDFPATAALVPQTVAPADLQRANALVRLGLSASQVGGAAVAGVLVVVVGAGPALLLDAGTFLLAAACYVRVRVDPLPLPGARRGALRDLAEGWREFRSRTWVWVVVAAFFLVNAAWVGGFSVVGLVVADATFGRAAWGLVRSAEAVGLLLGAAAAGWWRPARPLAVGMAATAALALPLAVLGVSPVLLVLLPVTLVAGACVQVFDVYWATSLQRFVPAERLARVLSFDALGSFAAIPLGQALAGPAADRLGAGPVLLGAAAVVVAAALAALATPAVRRLTWDRPAPPGRGQVNRAA